MLLLVCVVVLLLIYLLFKDRNFFKNKGLPYEKPLPILGNIWRLYATKDTDQYLFYDRYYQMAKKIGIGGIYQMMTPAYVITDPELIKNIAIKDFSHFVNHIKFSENDFFANSVFSLRDTKWKDVRTTLSPAFTNSKMRIMYDLIEKCVTNLLHDLNEESKRSKDGIVKKELKKFMSEFTNDVLATTAFGIEVNSFAEKENDFFLNSKDLTDYNKGFRWIKLFLIFINHKLINLLWKEGFYEEKPVKFFRQILMENIRARREKGIVRPDMIHLMLEIQKEEREKNNSEVLNDDEMVAQALIFIFGGFDTVSSTLTLVLHHLAKYPDVQQKLYEEIKTTLQKSNGKVEFQDVKTMPYLEMVLSESQRMNPVLSFLQRECNKRYTIPANGDRPEVTIEPGEMVIFLPYSLHHDPEYYPNPEKFDPERFSEENKSNFNPYTYMPFGIGPRFCIANKFAKLEMKMLMVHILKNFELIFIEQTESPIKFCKRAFFNIASQKGFWLGFKPRDDVAI